MEEKKNTPNEKEYQESVTGTAKLQTFSAKQYKKKSFLLKIPRFNYEF